MKFLNFPNFFTICRILLVPFFAYYFLRGQYGLALLLFIVTGLSDVIDGALARWLREKTILGAILDPAADKIVMLVSFVILSIRGHVPVWISALVILRDVYIVTGLWILKISEKSVTMRPTPLSKANTFFQLLVIFSAFLFSWLGEKGLAAPVSSYFPLLFKALLFIMAGMTLASGIQYTWIGMKILKTPVAKNVTVSLKKN